MTAQKRKLLTVLALAWVTYTVSYMCRVNISTALDKLAFGMDVSLDYLGMASSVYFITYAFGQLLNGFWGDHVDPHRFLIPACFPVPSTPRWACRAMVWCSLSCGA